MNMGCNCKKPQILNNTKSKDHLNLLFNVVENTINTKPKGVAFTEVEELRIKNVFIGIYPNVKHLPSTEVMVNDLTELYKQKKK